MHNISRGRFILGLGAGASPASRFGYELHAAGVEMLQLLTDRRSKLEHVMAVIDEIWSSSRQEKNKTFPCPIEITVKLNYLS